MRKKFRIPAFLMIAAMLLIVAFQVYWLNLNYKEERRNLRFRSNILFRECVFQLQATKLNLDSTMLLGYRSARDIARFADVVRARINNSVLNLPDAKNKMIAFEKMKSVPGSDSMQNTRNRLDGRFFDFLISIDSLQDSIKVREIITSYHQSLQKENIETPFVITRTDGAPPVNTEQSPRPEWNKITIGFKNPVTYQLDLGNGWSYLMEQILPQIIFSCFLIGLTILAFLVLYRNLLAQQRLTLIKNEFISNITHELKTPISTVSVAIEAMKNFNVLQDPARTREYLDIAGNELSRLSLLVDKVLKLSMFEKDQTDLKYERFDLKQLVQDVIASMRLQFEKYKAEVQLHAPQETVLLDADRLHITSVVYNFLDNALKYSKEHPRIDIFLESDKDLVTLRIKDTGIGIAPEYKNRIFEKFFRIPSGNMHNIKGYGLGLSYTAHIVKQHRGSIAVHSEPGLGTEFTIKLPVQHEEG
jgi:two-component system phosphate regulon sensor histidine kinase PhoR